MIPKRSKLIRYRKMSSDQRRLSRQPFNPLPSIRGLSKRQQKDRIRNHLAAQETNRSHQMIALALQPPPVPTRLSRTVPSPHAPPTAQIATPKTCSQSTTPDTDGADACGTCGHSISSSSAPGAHCPITEKTQKEHGSSSRIRPSHFLPPSYFPHTKIHFHSLTN